MYEIVLGMAVSSEDIIIFQYPALIFEIAVAMTK